MTITNSNKIPEIMYSRQVQNDMPAVRLSELCNKLSEKTMELLSLSDTSEKALHFKQVKQEVKALQAAIEELRAVLPSAENMVRAPSPVQR